MKVKPGRGRKPAGYYGPRTLKTALKALVEQTARTSRMEENYNTQLKILREQRDVVERKREILMEANAELRAQLEAAKAERTAATNVAAMLALTAAAGAGAGVAAEVKRLTAEVKALSEATGRSVSLAVGDTLTLERRA